MNEKSKLYVFDRTEVWIIFLFMIVTAVISFTLGINVGKNYSFKRDGYTIEDKAAVEETVDMVSQEEEQVNKVLDESKKVTPDEVYDDSYEKLKNEIDKELGDKKTGGVVEKETVAVEKIPVEQVEDQKPVEEAAPASSVKQESEDVANSGASARDDYIGKYTIQLGSYRSIEEAEEFASGFRVRGYNPIINEVELKSSGTWFRVSLGVFDSVSSAKNYILETKSLFQGQDYHITKFE